MTRGCLGLVGGGGGREGGLGIVVDDLIGYPGGLM